MLPLVVGAVVYAGLLVAWQAGLAPRLPDQVFAIDAAGEGILWSPLGPYRASDDWRECEVLVVGDSRVGSVEPGLVAAELDRSCGVLWSGGAEVWELIDMARDTGPRTLVAAVSPLSLLHPKPEGLDLLEQVPESFADVDELKEWMEGARRHFLDLGLEASSVDAVLGQWFTVERRKIERRELSTAEIDRRLGDRVDVWRSRRVRTLSSGPWRDSWFETVDTSASNESYRVSLRPETRAEREANFESLTERLRALVEAGWRVVCVRLPLAPELLEIEEDSVPSERFARLAAEAGVPFLDYSRADYLTGDGTHMTVTSGRRFSRELGRALRELEGR